MGFRSCPDNVDGGEIVHRDGREELREAHLFGCEDDAQFGSGLAARGDFDGGAPRRRRLGQRLRFSIGAGLRPFAEFEGLARAKFAAGLTSRLI